MRSSSDMPRSLESLDVELTEGARGGGLAGTSSLTDDSPSNGKLLPMDAEPPDDLLADATATGGGLVRALLLLCSRLEFVASEERLGLIAAEELLVAD